MIQSGDGDWIINSISAAGRQRGHGEGTFFACSEQFSEEKKGFYLEEIDLAEGLEGHGESVPPDSP